MSKDKPFSPGDLPPEVEEALKKLDFSSPTGAEELAMASYDVSEAFERAGFNRAESVYCTMAMFLGNPGIAPRP